MTHEDNVESSNNLTMEELMSELSDDDHDLSIMSMEEGVSQN